MRKLEIGDAISVVYGVKGVYLSLPSLVGQNGVESFLRLELSSSEQKQFRKSAKTLKDVIKKISSLK